MSAHTRIAVTGGFGILATALRPYFPYADFLSRQSCDVADGGSVKRWFSGHSYDLIIHAAAETNAAADPAALTQVNVVGTANVTHWARKQQARLVYASTDYVYPGTGGHRETDPVFPANGYAWSKLGGECAAQTYEKALIVRGSWYADLTLYKASTDGFTGKLPVEKAAGYLAALSTSTHTGIVNVGGNRRSLYEIVVSEFHPRCQPILRGQAGTAYPIPEDVSLDCSRLHQIVGW